MPMTDLTAPIIEDDCSFEHFLWLCAAQYMQNDEPVGVVRVKGLWDTSYFEQQLAKDKALFDKISQMTDTEYEAFQKQEEQAERDRVDQANAAREEAVARLLVMRERVLEWEPPTPDHKKVRALMLAQIEDTIYANSKPAVFRFTYTNLEKRLIALQESMGHNRRKIERTQKGGEHRAQWIATLREAVPIPDTLEVVE